MQNALVLGGVFGLAAGLALGASPPPETPTSGESAPSPAPATTTPTPPTPGQSILDLYYIELGLGLESAYDRRHSSAATGDRRRGRFRQTNTNWFLRETLSVESGGALLDPNLLTFELAVVGGLEQTSYTESRPGPDLHDDPSGSLFEYDIALDLLPRGRLSATAFATRQDKRISRAFLPSLDQSYERYGVELRFDDRRLPMRLTFEHIFDDITSRSGSLDDDEQRGRDRLEYEATWQISRDQELRLNYEYEDRSDEYSGSDQRFDTQRHELLLGHNLRFGPQQRSGWRSELRYQEEHGDLARDEFEIDSRLKLQHTPRLSTDYGVQFFRDAFEGYDARTVRGDIGATYEFNDQLTGTAQLYGLREDLDGNADSSEVGGILRADYRQRLAGGTLSGYAAYTGTVVDTDDGDRRAVVLNEAVVLRDPLPGYLAQDNIDIHSILVTNAANRRVYVLGRDYLIGQYGRYTALLRLPTGNITNGERVLVSYAYDVYQDYRIDRNRLDWRVQHDFDFGLAPYYAGSWQNEEFAGSQFRYLRGRDVNRHRLGATFRQPRWSASAEYEFNDDSIDPYQAAHLTGDVVLYRGARTDISANGSFSRFWFDGQRDLAARTTSLLLLGTSLRYYLARRVELTAAAQYRFEDDSLYGDTHGVDLTAAVEVEVGYFDVLFEAEYDVLDLQASRDETVAFWLKLRRTIPLLAGRRS